MVQCLGYLAFTQEAWVRFPVLGHFCDNSQKFVGGSGAIPEMEMVTLRTL